MIPRVVRQTRLIPPLVVDGVAYGAAVWFANGPRDNFDGPAIV
jgi:hypothetical protein